MSNARYRDAAGLLRKWSAEDNLRDERVGTLLIVMDTMDRGVKIVEFQPHGFYVWRGDLYMRRDGTWHALMGDGTKKGGTWFQSYDEAARACYGCGDDSFDPIHLGC